MSTNQLHAAPGAAARPRQHEGTTAATAGFDALPPAQF
jgi:hypothetical protein